MAWLETDPRSGNFKVAFFLGGQRFKRSLQTSDSHEATDMKRMVEQTIRNLERGWLKLPEGVEAADFVVSGGRLEAPLSLPARTTISQLFDAYFSSLPAGNLEDSTINGMKIHRRQLERILGASFAIRKLTTADLQRYIAGGPKIRGDGGKR